jgi:hypothetical protein
MSTALVDISYELINGIYTALLGNVSCPVYKSIPKTPETLYVHIHNVLHIEDGTKDDFIYTGTVQIEVVDESKMRADKKAAQTVLGSVRSTLKPSKAAVFSIGTRTLTVFSHGSYNEFIELADNGISRVRLIDIFNFIIE